MKRHCPFAALRLAEEKARVAVPSRILASAAAWGFNTPPARDTGTAEVGFLSVAVADAAGDEDCTGAFWVGAWDVPVAVCVEIDVDAGAGVNTLGVGFPAGVDAKVVAPLPSPKEKD